MPPLLPRVAVEVRPTQRRDRSHVPAPCIRSGVGSTVEPRDARRSRRRDTSACQRSCGGGC
jgi:hypothetical protein